MTVANQKESRGGYIAVTTALIVVAVVVAAMFVDSLSSFAGRSDALSIHQKELSRELARACVSAARLELFQNPAYAGGEAVAVASDTCSIVSVAASGTTKVIDVQADYRNSYTCLIAAVNSSDLSLAGMQEVSHF